MELTNEFVNLLFPEGLVFNGRKAFIHHDDGWSWTWLISPGKYGLCPITEEEIQMIKMIIIQKDKLDKAMELIQMWIDDKIDGEVLGEELIKELSDKHESKEPK